MNKLKQQPGSSSATLNDLVALVEKAALTLTDLQTEKAALIKQAQQALTVAPVNAEFDIHGQRIEAHAQAEAAMREENAALMKEVQEAQMLARAKASEAEIQAQRIEELEQSEAALKEQNAALSNALQESQTAAQAQASELDIRRQRNNVLDQSIEALKKDADLCRWMRSKFGNSSFLNHIEKLYFSDHPEEKKIR